MSVTGQGCSPWQALANLGDAIFDKPHVIQCIWDYLQFPTNTGVFSKVFSKHLHRRMHIHISCISLSFLQRELSYVSSNWLPDMMQKHTGCICLSTMRFHVCSKIAWLNGCIITYVAFVLSFHHHGFSYVSSNHLHKRMHNHTGCISLTFLRCVFSNGS